MNLRSVGPSERRGGEVGEQRGADESFDDWLCRPGGGLPPVMGGYQGGAERVGRAPTVAPRPGRLIRRGGIHFQDEGAHRKGLSRYGLLQPRLRVRPRAGKTSASRCVSEVWRSTFCVPATGRVHMRALPGGEAPHLNGTTGNGGATHASQLRQLSHGALRGDGNPAVHHMRGH